MPNSETERGRDEQGVLWQLVRPSFLNWRDEWVVTATTGWEQGGAVRRDLHIPLDDWLSWEVVEEP